MSGCSGTLVHPEIILYAAHCPGAGSARFGVTGNDRSVAIEYCVDAPEYPKLGYDYAYCRLSQPVDDVPIVPILMGCERDQLPIGQRVSLVGYGNTSNGGGGFGTKRWIEGAIAGFPDEGKKIGIFYDDIETGICNGDSGGSAYVQLDDGSWRMFGIASTVPGSCGGSSQHIPAWFAVAWVEEHSGLDITPCHDADGAWNPSPQCTGFPLDPHDGAGLSWNNGCGPGSMSPAAQTCGPRSGQAQDRNAPIIEFVSPLPGDYTGPVYNTPIEVAVTDEWGILDVTIAFDGVDQAFFEAEPYLIGSANFPEGTWELEATARDWAGNVAEASVTFEVGPVGGTRGTGGDPSTGSASASTTLGETGDAPLTSGASTGGLPTGQDGESTEASSGTDDSAEMTDEQADDGCSCRSSAPSWSAALLGWLVLLRRRRASLLPED